MKQLISVRAVIRRGNKILLLRRGAGRATILGKYELPGGKLDYDEQPEDALRRHVFATTGLTPASTQLVDVLSYIDHDNRDIQYTFIIYNVLLDDENTKVKLGEKYDKYVWKNPNQLTPDTVTESSSLLLRVVDSTGDEEITTEHLKPKEGLIIYSDGGSRGNPGPSAAGFVIMNWQQEFIGQGGEYLGITTNNQAEYHGVRMGLERALEMGARVVECRTDSLLVANQLRGVYKIKNRELWPINERIRELVAQFEKVTFVHVRREFNQLADGMVNKILDSHAATNGK